MTSSVTLSGSTSVRVLVRPSASRGVKVKIMLDWDPKGRTGPKTPIPDTVTIHNPKDEDESALAKPSLARNSRCRAAVYRMELRGGGFALRCVG